MKLMCIDTETGGLPDWSKPSGSPQQPHICELAAIKYDEAGKELERFHSFVRPDGWSIAIEAQKAHGYSVEYLMDVGRDERDVVRDYMDFQGDADIRIGHNESFDARILRIALKRFAPCDQVGHFDLEQPQRDAAADAYRARLAMCTMRLATDIVKLPPTPAMGKRWKYKNPTLGETYSYFFGEAMEGAHGAVADTENCAKVFFHMLHKGFIARARIDGEGEVVSTHHIIHCMYCLSSSTAKDVSKDGWRLAKSAPLRYVCPDIRCRAQEQRSAHDTIRQMENELPADIYGRQKDNNP